MLELVRIHPNLAPNQLQMSHETLKTVLTTIIMPSLVKKSDARLKGTEIHGPSGRRVSFSNQNTTRYTNAISTSRVGSLTFNSESNSELDSHAENVCRKTCTHFYAPWKGS